MNENNESARAETAPFGGAAQAYVKFWSDFAAKMTAAAFAAPSGSTPPEAMREVRSAMLKGMSDSCEQYMRSPQFQEALKQWFAHSIQFRTQMNDWASRLHHEIQGVSRQDVDALIQAIGRVETRVCERLERLTERLDTLEQQRGTAAPPSGGMPSRPNRQAQERKAKR